MARVCIVGVGTPAFLPDRHHAGPGLRAAHFAEAAAGNGHDVLLICVEPEQAPSRLPVVRGNGGGMIRCVFVKERTLVESAAQELSRFKPDVLVGATAYASSLATRFWMDVPFWADVFGDFMAEAQAKANKVGRDGHIVHFWRMLGPVLERADRFSAVSVAQAHALVGQLGLVGRLSARTAGERLVHVVPCGVSAAAARPSGSARLRGSVVPDDAFIVLWSGGFNTWCDTGTLFTGLEGAMAKNDRVRFVCTGAAISGHDEVSYRHFCDLVAGSRFAPRFHLLGWVDSELLHAYYSDSDLGVSIELELYERELGSENRVVVWAAHGLPCLTTARSELGSLMAREGLAVGVLPGDGAAVACAIDELARDPRRLEAMGEACRRYAVSHLGWGSTAAPLLDWLADPQRAGDSRGDRVLTVGLFSEPGANVELLEAYLAELTIPQVAYRSTRWLWRRISRSLRV